MARLASITSAVSHEETLLLLCARFKMSNAQRADLQDLIKCEVNWTCVMEMAIENRVTSLLYLHLKAFSGNAIPRRILSALRNAYLRTIGQNIRMNQELMKIVRALESNGIPVMLLKGAALECILERSILARTKYDIDILMHEQDFYRAQDALRELGYAPSQPLPKMSERELVEYAHCFDQIKLYGEKGMKIDVHFRLLNMGMPRVEESLVWSRSRYARADDGRVLVPSPEDMLLHLCFHANHHGFASLHHFCDIHDVLDHVADGIDWKYFVQAAQERKIEATMYYALAIAGRLLGSSVSPSVYERLKPKRAKRMVFEFLWLKGMNLRRRRRCLGSFEGPFYYLMEMDKFKPKMTFAWKLLFPPLRWLSRDYRRSESVALRCGYLIGLLRRYRYSIRYGEK